MDGIRVLDLSRIMAGPWATQVFADLGAEVIKVERPLRGDDTRSWGPPFAAAEVEGSAPESGYFLCVNRGKQSIELDLRDPGDVAVLHRLVGTCDVVVENFRVGTLQRVGLDYDSVRRVNPSVVYCSVTGFGQTGPRRAEPAYDFAIQAMCGLMSVTGAADGEAGAGPQKVGVPIVDLATGLYAAIAVLAALVRRGSTGRGDYIDLAMLDVGVSLMSNQAMNYLLTGRAPQRRGNAHPNIQPQDVFATADGHLALVVGNDDQFGRLCEVLGLPGLSDDPRYATNAVRVEQRSDLVAVLAERFGTRTTAHWAEVLRGAGVPCSPINDLAAVLADPQVAARGLLGTVTHPTLGALPIVTSPFRYRQAVVRHGSPPTLGGSNDVVAQSAEAR